MPACFELPDERSRFRSFVKACGEDASVRTAFVRKPEGAWGGHGIQIRYGVDDLLPGEEKQMETCTFAPLVDVQCLGLSEATSAGASDSEASCKAACCDDDK